MKSRFWPNPLEAPLTFSSLARGANLAARVAECLDASGAAPPYKRRMLHAASQAHRGPEHECMSELAMSVRAGGAAHSSRFIPLI